MEDWIIKADLHNYIVVANVDTIVTCKFNASMQEAVNNSSLAIPDGFPLVLLGRLYGYPLKKRAYGPDLMFEFLRMTEGKGYSHFFYGATQNTLAKMIKKITVLFPKTKIAGYYDPPFRPLTREEDSRIVEMINKLAPDVLWIGIGCPKQELWMSGHSSRLSIPVMVGVGAAFDFLAGSKRQAPWWMRNYGFEWLFRLLTEPKRLWRRYLINNLLFIYFVGIELVFKASVLRRIKPKQ
jgi:N-acetylglucosaminyldiphosphoundecaprenol N-acetyl-beta-D-mannosaminyltransferase